MRTARLRGGEKKRRYLVETGTMQEEDVADMCRPVVRASEVIHAVLVENNAAARLLNQYYKLVLPLRFSRFSESSFASKEAV